MLETTTSWPLNKNGDPSWGIREFAGFFGITPRAVRFYEDKGLLSPERRGAMRIFTPRDYMRLTKILRAKRLGFTLDDIKEVLDVTDGLVHERAELLRRKSNFETVIRSLKRRREDIDILTKDMTEICDVISQTLDRTPDMGGIFDLADRYEATFRQTLEDDFHPDINAHTHKVEKEIDHA